MFAHQSKVATQQQTIAQLEQQADTKSSEEQIQLKLARDETAELRHQLATVSNFAPRILPFVFVCRSKQSAVAAARRFNHRLCRLK